MAALSFVDAVAAANITGGPFDGVAFYIGGNAYRVWTVTEVASRGERYRLPVWVRSNPGAVDPVSDAVACAAALRRFGVPAGALVALDSETAVDAAWTRQFVDTLNQAGQGGHPVIDYGSQSVVKGNKNPDCYYWGADWTSVSHLASGDQMTQFVSFANEDVSAASAALPFWDTRPPRPAPLGEDDMTPVVLTAAVLPGDGATAVVLPVPAGMTKVVLLADAGLGKQVPPVLRVGTSPHWTVNMHASPTWAVPVTVVLPPGTVRVTIARMDKGTVPVTVWWEP